MRIALLLAGSLLFGSAAAQGSATPKSQDPAKLSPLECEQLLQELQQKAIDDWRASLEAAQKARENPDGKPVRAVRMRPDFGPVATKAYGFAKQFRGTDDAVPFLMMVVQMSTDKAEQKKCIEQMLESHLDSPELAEMGTMLGRLPRMIDQEFADMVRTKMLGSKDADVQGWALFATCKPAIEKADRDSDEYAIAKAALVVFADKVEDRRLQSEITGAIELREKYGVGCTAPDISGIDLDGVAFKLSDYKGKVIFLDFWGDW